MVTCDGWCYYLIKMDDRSFVQTLLLLPLIEDCRDSHYEVAAPIPSLMDGVADCNVTSIVGSLVERCYLVIR